MNATIARALLCAVVASAAAAAAGCSNDPTVNSNNSQTGSNIVFVQIDREGRPGLKELYLPYASHDAFNRAVPTTDVGTAAPLVATFVTGTAGRSAAIGAYVSDLLTPDALIANLGSTATRASYLGWETGGTITDDCTGLAPTNWGGRALTDDVVNADLGLAFGNLATAANPVASSTPAGVATAVPADDGAEKNGSNGTPNLMNQDVSCAGKGYQTNTFPYLAEPI